MNMKEHIETIAKCRIFEGISKSEMESLLPYLKPDIRRYKKGEYIIMAGDKVTDIFILLRGCVQIIKEDILGERTLIAQYLTGDSFCEPSVNLPKSSVNICASVNSVVMAVPFENIINMHPFLMRFHSKILRNIISILSYIVFNEVAKLDHVSKHNIRKKIFSYLLDVKNKAGNNEFFIPFSKTDLSDYLFINRSAMTRELSAMRKDKLINFKGRKFTINID
ncbi:MAG: Crp/Fnr family transcriptional regulator [Endomicrobia bacterium]|nr:Crp/Fnr family transcriptional regulator [Endomicrobiia bacterium]